MNEPSISLYINVHVFFFFKKLPWCHSHNNLSMAVQRSHACDFLMLEFNKTFYWSLIFEQPHQWGLVQFISWFSRSLCSIFFLFIFLSSLKPCLLELAFNTNDNNDANLQKVIASLWAHPCCWISQAGLNETALNGVGWWPNQGFTSAILE